ncbi:hypothetical protein [Helcococcus kunzii]|uniref:hypothetical protein n=1 Tax=Helcococcus kunzii TaxID=40091 RepID=UPI0024ADC36D|nr:hypothetical protein [Helcococcus kunzii]
MAFSSFIDRQGVNVTVVKHNGSSFDTKALINIDKDTNEKFLAFYVDTDVSENDKVIFPDGKEIFLQEIETQYWQGEPSLIHGYYGKNETKASQIFNIGNVSQSNIGNYNSINIGNSLDEIKSLIESNSNDKDKNSLIDLTNEIEKLTMNSKDIKPGMFSKFENLLKRNTWFANSIGQILVAYVTKQIGG